ncbi:MAG: hypothetical protein Q9182_006851 [Xanthomendoza sp. 2 TL-2023]
MHWQQTILLLSTLAIAENIDLYNQAAPHPPTPLDTCDCTGTNNTGPRGVSYICRDPRLGPAHVPKEFPLLSIVSDYDRFGGLTPGAFLKRWTDAETGKYVYPPKNGFHLNRAGEAIVGTMRLEVGTKVDRFGSVYISAADAPYSQRSLPPSNLDNPPETHDYPYNYHIYNVVKSFEVEGGPIAPWFGQPGLGAQFYVGATGNILGLLEKGFLERVKKKNVRVGGGRGGSCGL